MKELEHKIGYHFKAGYRTATTHSSLRQRGKRARQLQRSAWNFWGTPC